MLAQRVLRPGLQNSEVPNPQGQELPRRAWVWPTPGHYKHGQFLCLSFPPYAAQRKGWPRQISGGVPFRLLQWLQCARGLVGYGWGLCVGAREGTASSPPLFHPERLPGFGERSQSGSCLGLPGCGSGERRVEPRVQDGEQARHQVIAPASTPCQAA